MSYSIKFQLSLRDSSNIAYGNIKYLDTTVKNQYIYLQKIKSNLNSAAASFHSAQYIVSFRVLCNNTGKVILHYPVKYKIL
jgi:hypothetical protein